MVLSSKFIALYYKDYEERCATFRSRVQGYYTEAPNFHPELINPHESQNPLVAVRDTYFPTLNIVDGTSYFSDPSTGLSTGFTGYQLFLPKLRAILMSELAFPILFQHHHDQYHTFLSEPLQKSLDVDYGIATLPPEVDDFCSTLSKHFSEGFDKAMLFFQFGDQRANVCVALQKLSDNNFRYYDYAQNRFVKLSGLDELSVWLKWVSETQSSQYRTTCNALHMSYLHRSGAPLEEADYQSLKKQMASL